MFVFKVGFLKMVSLIPALNCFAYKTTTGLVLGQRISKWILTFMGLITFEWHTPLTTYEDTRWTFWDPSLLCPGSSGVQLPPFPFPPIPIPLSCPPSPWQRITTTNNKRMFSKNGSLWSEQWCKGRHSNSSHRLAPAPLFIVTFKCCVASSEDNVMS